MTEERSIGYEEGYQAGWNAAMDAKPEQPAPVQGPVAWISAVTGDMTTQNMSHTVSWAPLYTTPQAQPAPVQRKATTYGQRFAHAVALLCGAQPPADMVAEWIANVEVNGEHRLQGWVLTQAATPFWAQGIVVLDAAHVLANDPEEGEGHEAAPQAQPAQQEPVAEVKAKMTGGNVGIATVIHEIHSPLREPLQPGDKLYPAYRWIGWDVEQVWSERIFGIDMRFENVQDAIAFREKLDEATTPPAQRQEIEYCTDYRCAGDCGRPHNQEEMLEFIAAEQPAQQEPDAFDDDIEVIGHNEIRTRWRLEKGTKLYTTPPAQPAPVQEPMATVLPDGSAFSVVSFSLPHDHWLYAPYQYMPGHYDPVELPSPVVTHADRDRVVAAIRYAVRGATLCGKEPDFDPDALVQNATYALCGPFNAAPQAQPAREPLTPAQKIALAEDWFAEDWAITKAVGMMVEYEMRIAHGITKGNT